MSSNKTAHKLNTKWRSDDIKAEESIDFSTFCLKPLILKGLRKAGFKIPSPVQLKSIPFAVFGEDLIIQAKSGTGKTCVFAIAALEILVDSPTLQVLILAPTREIAVQVCGVINSIGSQLPKLQCHMFIGGTPVSEDIKKLENCQVAVGTMGRLRQLVELGVMTVGCVRLLVLDEADNMMNFSFSEDLHYICNRLPESKQVLALSATYPPDLLDCVKKVMRTPRIIRIDETELALKGILQFYQIIRYHPVHNIVSQAKFSALLDILNNVAFSQCLVYCRSIGRVDYVCDLLNKSDHAAAKISSGDSQEMRITAMNMLKDFQCRIMVSSDLTARGIDAENVDMVINIDIPDTLETYLHRIGRAGRYGSKAIAITFATSGQEEQKLGLFEKHGNFKIHALPNPLPWELLTWTSDMLKECKTRRCKRSLAEFNELPSLADTCESDRADDWEADQLNADHQEKNGMGGTSIENIKSSKISTSESDSSSTESSDDDEKVLKHQTPNSRHRLSSDCDDTKVFTDVVEDEFSDISEAGPALTVEEIKAYSFSSTIKVGDCTTDDDVTLIAEESSYSTSNCNNFEKSTLLDPKSPGLLCVLPEESSEFSASQLSLLEQEDEATDSAEKQNDAVVHKTVDIQDFCKSDSDSAEEQNDAVADKTMDLQDSCKSDSDSAEKQNDAVDKTMGVQDSCKSDNDSSSHANVETKNVPSLSGTEDKYNDCNDLHMNSNGTIKTVVTPIPETQNVGQSCPERECDIVSDIQITEMMNKLCSHENVGPFISYDELLNDYNACMIKGVDLTVKNEHINPTERKSSQDMLSISQEYLSQRRRAFSNNIAKMTSSDSLEPTARKSYTASNDIISKTQPPSFVVESSTKHKSNEEKSPECKKLFEGKESGDDLEEHKEEQIRSAMDEDQNTADTLDAKTLLYKIPKNGKVNIKKWEKDIKRLVGSKTKSKKLPAFEHEVTENATLPVNGCVSQEKGFVLKNDKLVELNVPENHKEAIEDSPEKDQVCDNEDGNVHSRLGLKERERRFKTKTYSDENLKQFSGGYKSLKHKSNDVSPNEKDFQRYSGKEYTDPEEKSHFRHAKIDHKENKSQDSYSDHETHIDGIARQHKYDQMKFRRETHWSDTRRKISYDDERSHFPAEYCAKYQPCRISGLRRHPENRPIQCSGDLPHRCAFRVDKQRYDGIFRYAEPGSDFISRQNVSLQRCIHCCGCPHYQVPSAKDGGFLNVLFECASHRYCCEHREPQESCCLFGACKQVPPLRCAFGQRSFYSDDEGVDLHDELLERLKFKARRCRDTRY